MKLTDEDKLDMENGLGRVLLRFDAGDDDGVVSDQGKGDEAAADLEGGTEEAAASTETKPPPADADISGAQPETVVETKAAPEPVTDFSAERMAMLERRVSRTEARRTEPVQPEVGGDLLGENYSGVTQKEHDDNPVAATRKMIADSDKIRAQADQTTRAADEAQRIALGNIRTAQDRSYDVAVVTLPSFASDSNLRQLYEDTVAADPQAAMDPRFPEKFANGIIQRYPHLSGKASAKPDAGGQANVDTNQAQELAELKIENARLKQVRTGHMTTERGGGRTDTGGDKVIANDDHREYAKAQNITVAEAINLLGDTRNI